MKFKKLSLFQSARLKLTLFYLGTIMLISGFFSAVIYRGMVFEIARTVRQQARRDFIREFIENSQNEPPFFGRFDQFPTVVHQEIYDAARKRLLWEIIAANAAILFFAAVAGWFLSSITLSPIAKMVEDQEKFVADASHELRTPLAAMTLQTEVALRDKKMNLASAREVLRSSLEEANKLKSLTDYFLKLNFYQDSHLKLKYTSQSVTELVVKVCDRFVSLAAKKKINLVQNLAEIEADVENTSFSELVSILLDNAVKFSPENKSIVVSLIGHKGDLILSVQDFGEGIAKEDLPKIFQRFYQADASRNKNENQGYGIGLSLAQDIVDLYQGEIKVQSEKGKGSTFTVLLPQKQKTV